MYCIYDRDKIIFVDWRWRGQSCRTSQLGAYGGHADCMSRYLFSLILPLKVCKGNNERDVLYVVCGSGPEAIIREIRSGISVHVISR
jgi:hypothetical protein